MKLILRFFKKQILKVLSGKLILQNAEITIVIYYLGEPIYERTFGLSSEDFDTLTGEDWKARTRDLEMDE